MDGRGALPSAAPGPLRPAGTGGASLGPRGAEWVLNLGSRGLGVSRRYPGSAPTFLPLAPAWVAARLARGLGGGGRRGARGGPGRDGSGWGHGDPGQRDGGRAPNAVAEGPSLKPRLHPPGNRAAVGDARRGPGSVPLQRDLWLRLSGPQLR